MKMKYFGLTAWLMVVALFACGDDCPVCEKVEEETPPAPEYLSSAYFTTDFDSLGQPASNLDTVVLDSIAGDSLYLLVKWFDFDAGTIAYRTEWYDGSGMVENVFSQDFNIPGGNWSTRTWQVFHGVLHSPGEWIVKTLIDGIVARADTVIVQ